MCAINTGILALPRGWTGGALACGHNHCIIHAVHEKTPEGRAYVAGSNSHFQLGHGGTSSRTLRVVRSLCTRNIMAVFAEGNQSCAIDKEGRLASFGEGWTDADAIGTKEPIIHRDCNFQDVALGDSQFAMVKKEDGHYGLVKVGSPISHFDSRDITDFKSVKSGGNYVGVKVVLQPADP